MIKVEGISKDYRDFKLSDIDIQIGMGDYVVLLGNSGSGKSLFLEIMAGLIPPDQGRILLNGENITEVSIQRRPFGMVFQDLALFPHMTVAENIAYSLKGQGLREKHIKNKIEELAVRLEIQHILNRGILKLSGGEKQRVAIARTLANEPACLLLDEPLSSLDTQLKKEVRALLRWLNQTGQTVLHVTHDYEEALSLASHIGVMSRGSMIQYGVAETVLRQPMNQFVANFTGVKNYFRVKVTKDQLEGGAVATTEDGVKIRLSSDKPEANGHIIVPCESVFLSKTKISTSALNQYYGKIQDIHAARFGMEVLIMAELPITATLTAAGLNQLGLDVGDNAWVNFKAAAVQFIRK